MLRPSRFGADRYTRIGEPPTSISTVSVTIITKNEAADIVAALRSVAWADERVVVDSGSTDGTVELARPLADRVVTHAWEGYGAQKNFAASLATHDWILSLDADERKLSLQAVLPRLAHVHVFHWLPGDPMVLTATPMPARSVWPVAP